MTWLGKILAMLVMILSLVWMYFTVNVYVTRTNWKTAADKYKKAYEEAIEARSSEYRIHQSADDAYARKLSALNTEAAGLRAQYDTLMKANADNVASMKALAKAIEESDITAVQLQINLKSTISEADEIRRRANKLEDERVVLALKAEQAAKERLEAQNDLKLAVSRQEDAERRLEILQADLKELRALGGSGGGLLGRGVLGKDGGPAPAEGTRGTVTRVDGDFVQLSIGIDAGLRAGMTLDLIRIETGKYLGTVTVQHAGLEPKRAVATFKPADALRPIARLRPDELPKVGDQVTKVETSRVSK